jgi:hypothetical protein
VPSYNGLNLLYDDRLTPQKGSSLFAVSNEDPDYPAVNVLQVDRGVIYRSLSAPPATVTIDVITYNNPAISGVGVMNLRTTAPAGSEPIVNVYNSSSLSWGSPILTATLNAIAENGAINFASALLASYSGTFWRFAFSTGSYQFSIGKLILGTWVAFPYWYSPDSVVSTVEPSDEIRTIGKVPITVIAGETRKEYSLKFEEVPDADLAVWETILYGRVPFALVDVAGRVRHVRLAGARRIEYEHKFGVNPNLWSFTVPIEELP